MSFFICINLKFTKNLVDITAVFLHLFMLVWHVEAGIFLSWSLLWDISDIPGHFCLRVCWVHSVSLDNLNFLRFLEHRSILLPSCIIQNLTQLRLTASVILGLLGHFDPLCFVRTALLAIFGLQGEFLASGDIWRILEYFKPFRKVWTIEAAQIPFGYSRQFAPF